MKNLQIHVFQENIRYGREGVTKEQIVEAAKKAFAHDFITALPDVSNRTFSTDNLVSSAS